MKFGSLFAGIGGFDLGLERAGMECSWQVEIDDYATKVLEKHWPNVKRYSDIRDCRDLEPVDLICGGFPCQDISCAGKKAGITGKRSGLWREYKRVVSEVRPDWVLIENVANLRGNGLVTVLQDLREIGYDAEWHIIPASAVGALHRRERIWIIANAHGKRGWFESWRGSGKSGEVAAQPGVDGEEEFMAHTHDSRLKKQRGSFAAQTKLKAPKRCDWWKFEPDVGRVANGVPRRVDRLKCLGNAIVPQIAEYLGNHIKAQK